MSIRVSLKELREIVEYGIEGAGSTEHLMAAELLKRREDEIAAAGELAVSIPIPGSIVAKLLIANRLLKAERAILLEAIHNAQHALTLPRMAKLSEGDRS